MLFVFNTAPVDTICPLLKTFVHFSTVKSLVLTKLYEIYLSPLQTVVPCTLLQAAALTGSSCPAPLATAATLERALNAIPFL